MRRKSLDAIRDLNEAALVDLGDPEIATRIASYEMAYRMQSSVPGLMDIASEPKEIHDLYGTGTSESFANSCLLARRLVERGVRFVHLLHRDWDHHLALPKFLPMLCEQTDRACSALIQDLKQRGLLDSTLVVWGGEFGRTPMSENRIETTEPWQVGRDHHPRAFTIWMAGGGIKPGLTIGKTDDLGYNVVEDAVHVHDLNATILHCLGIDHERLTFRFQGRDYRLTDTEGTVVRKLLA